MLLQEEVRLGNHYSQLISYDSDMHLMASEEL